MEVKAYAVMAEGEELKPFTVERRAPGAEEVLVELMYCGICHTDLILANNENGQAMYPVVPGHEMIGRVAEAGADVRGFTVGDIVGIGCIADIGMILARQPPEGALNLLGIGAARDA